ncbi:hypothetical protein XM38_034640 [Halomicronema hongdechloris C2206]|uniref:DUF8201 domain-containing protein n=1 Tax=Halomicronema hongdechloris C2206 TaxID=1641165 RepID=A0A1Z3HQI3_9CYAN|nr:hypothetical protein [Halomicronema hongdechloris]ASC72506.1 hypothetical protein XM38_034640 [Halomicronema hongdechloris C2206]
MLYFIAVWSLLGGVSWLMGTALLHGWRADCFDRVGDRAMVALWLGIGLLSQGLLLLSLGLPLSPMVGAGVAIASLLLLAWAPVRADLSKLWRQVSWPLVVATIAWVAVVATYMTRRVTWYDTGLYHYGAIRWLSDYGAVPGLALLMENFGFTSAWFALAAPLNAAPIASQVSAITNGLALLLATGQGLMGLRRWLTGRARFPDKFMVIFLGLVLPAMTLTSFLSAILLSPSPDIPVIFLTGMVAWSLLVVANQPPLPSGSATPSGWDATLIPLILATAAVSIKLSALPLLPVALLFYWRQRPWTLRRLLVGGVLAAGLMVPFMAFGIITSGCPFYPSAALCLEVPWRLSAAQADAAAEVIRIWDNAFGTPPAETNSLLWRLWQWLQFARLNVVMLVLLVVSILVVSIAGRGGTFGVARQHKLAGTPWLFGLSLLGMLFILLRAPMIRFGLGYFVMTPAVAIALLRPFAVSRSHGRLPQGVSGQTLHNLIFLAFWAGFGVVGALHLLRSDMPARWLLPPAMPTTDVEVRQSYDVNYVSPNNDRGQCWDAPLPCAPGDKAIRLRNPAQGIDAGFVPADPAD